MGGISKENFQTSEQVQLFSALAFHIGLVSSSKELKSGPGKTVSFTGFEPPKHKNKQMKK